MTITTYPQGKVHVVVFVARKPDQSIRPVGLEREFESLLQVSSKVVFGKLIEDVQDPLGSVVDHPLVVVWRQRWRRRGPWSVGNHVDRQRVSQHEVEQI